MECPYKSTEHHPKQLTLAPFVEGGEPRTVHLMTCGLLEKAIGWPHFLETNYCSRKCMAGRTEYPTELTADLRAIAIRALKLRLEDFRTDDPEGSSPWRSGSRWEFSRETAIRRLQELGESNDNILKSLKIARSKRIDINFIMELAKKTGLVEEDEGEAESNAGKEDGGVPSESQ